MRIVLLTGLSLTMLAAGTADVSAGMITIQPTSDRGGTDSPRGGEFESLRPETDVELSVQNQTNVIPIVERRAAIEFDLNSLPSSSTILSATLTLTITGTNGFSPPTFRVYGYAGDGAVELGDMLETSNLLSGSIASAGLGKRMIDVTSFLEDLIGGSEGYAGFLVAADLDTSDTLNSFLIGSSNQSNALNRPTLNIEYQAAAVPEPASLTLFGAGLVALGGGAWRRRRTARDALRAIQTVSPSMGTSR